MNIILTTYLLAASATSVALAFEVNKAKRRLACKGMWGLDAIVMLLILGSVPPLGMLMLYKLIKKNAETT